MINHNDKRKEKEFSSSLLAHYQDCLGSMAGGAGHRLNGIFSAIAGYARFLAESESLSVQEKEFANRLLSGVERGVEITRMLECYSLSSAADVNCVYRRLKPLLDDIIENVRARIDRSGVILEANIEDTLPVYSDLGLLSGALLSLFINAFHAACKNGNNQRFIRVTSRMEDNEAVIRVFDNGLPYSTNFLVPDIKHPGLVGAYGTIRAIGGAMTFEQRFDGNEIRISLPLSRPLFDQRLGRVLVVDDDPAIRHMFSQFLDHEGYRVEAVPDAPSAINMLQEQDFDVVLLDQMMPGMSGLEFLATARVQNIYLPPVVMITGADDVGLARRALQAGATACVRKPVNSDNVLYIVESLTGTPHKPRGIPNMPGISLLNKRIALVVNSDIHSAEAMSAVLAAGNFSTIVASDGATAERETSGEYFDIILTEAQLTDMSGVSAVRKMRINNPFTPILITSPVLSRATLAEMLEAGANGKLESTIDLPAIVGQIDLVSSIFAARAAHA